MYSIGLDGNTLDENGWIGLEEDGLDSAILNEDGLDEDSRGADSICEVIGCGANWTEWWINYLTTNSNKLNHFIFTLISNDISFGTEIFLASKKLQKSRLSPTCTAKFQVSSCIGCMGGFGHISYL